jgi:hypothetical protein
MPQVQPSEEIMERKHFDRVTRHIATAGSRRGAVRALAATAVGLAALVGGHQDATEARHQHKKHKRGTSPAPKGLKEVCTPGVDTCSAGLRCDTPTTRHTCSSRVQGVSDWCCVPPGGSCTECDCCGDFYCEFDDDNQPHCVANPEG